MNCFASNLPVQKLFRVFVPKSWSCMSINYGWWSDDSPLWCLTRWCDTGRQQGCSWYAVQESASTHASAAHSTPAVHCPLPPMIHIQPAHTATPYSPTSTSSLASVHTMHPELLQSWSQLKIPENFNNVYLFTLRAPKPKSERLCFRSDHSSWTDFCD